MISFRLVADTDIPLIHRWRNEPHVMRWWYEDDGSEPTLEVVAKNYGPNPDEPERRFIILLDEQPIGYVQTYALADYPLYRDAINEDGHGMDLFIGEPAMINRGVGTEVLRAFLDQVVFADRSVTMCLVDPEVTNAAAIRAYEKAGFERVRELVVPGEPGPALLMRARRDR